MTNIKHGLLLCGAAALGFSGIALASGSDAAASIVKVGNGENAVKVTSQDSSSSDNMLAGITVGQNLIKGGTVTDKVKNGTAVSGFLMMPMPYLQDSGLQLIVSAGYAKNKAKANTATDYDLTKTSAAAGVMYPVTQEGDLGLYVGGELGYAKYEKKPSGAGTSGDESKMFQQIELMTTYKFDGSWDAVGRVSYDFTKANFSDFAVKDSNALQWSIGVAHTL
jgi:hypothetical protein